MKALTVIEAFGDYSRGHQITDAKAIAGILESEQRAKVVAIELPESKVSTRVSKTQDEAPPSA